MTKTIPSKEAFTLFVADFQSQPNYRKPIAFALCIVNRGQLNHDKILQATFPVVNYQENFGSFAVFCDAALKNGHELDFSKSEWNIPVDESFLKFTLSNFFPYIAEADGDKHKNIQVVQEILKFCESKDSFKNGIEKNHAKTNEEVPEAYKKMFDKNEESKKIFFFTAIFDDVQVISTQAAYLKLYLLSLGKVSIRSLNLNGIFKILHNVAWSGNIPYELEYLREKEIKMKINGRFPTIDFVDKFPRFLQHIIPADNTRILETSKVRFGAQLADCTTVMPGASYINFNAGTTGPVMVEGRISSSAIVGAGSDVGGGASILGVLSGTDGVPVTIGENCLLGANSVTGISLGNGCIVDAGIAVLAGTKFFVESAEMDKIMEVNSSMKLEPVEESSELDENIQKEDEIIYLLVKGEDVSGFNGLHFRQDSENGTMIIKRSTREVKLNSELH